MVQKKTEADHLAKTRDVILQAALPDVSFDGWSDALLQNVIPQTKVDSDLAHLAFPRGGLDMALYFHRCGDTEMVKAVLEHDLDSLKIRDKITLLVRLRIEAVSMHKEAVRRGFTLFALPHLAPEGAQAIWRTADRIWNTIGDASRDYNWYSKRATLSAVLSATVLFWLGDESDDSADTWDFLDRRITGVMRFEKAKHQFRESPLGQLAKGPLKILDIIKAPDRSEAERSVGVGLPGV